MSDISHPFICSSGIRRITSEMIPVAVVAGENGGTLDDHGAKAFDLNTGVAALY